MKADESPIIIVLLISLRIKRELHISGFLRRKIDGINYTSVKTIVRK